MAQSSRKKHLNTEMQEINSLGICLDAPSVMMSVRCDETLHHCQAHVRICTFDPDLFGEYSATSQSLSFFNYFFE